MINSTNPLSVAALQVQEVRWIHIAVNSPPVTGDTAPHHYAAWCRTEDKQLHILCWVGNLHRPTRTRHLYIAFGNC